MKDPRTQTLLEEFHDDSLGEDECRGLMEWFDEDESRVSVFVDELRTGNALAALCVLDSDGIAPAVTDSLSGAGSATDISSCVRKRIESGFRHPTDNAGRSLTATRVQSRWLISCVSAMVILSTWFALGPDAPPADRGAVIARVTHSVDPVWSGGAIPHRGDVTTGLLELKAGIVRLDFRSGASVTLQGPAAYEITGPMQTRLHYGVLTARIRESAIGFIVETSAMDVVDLGTAFGVSVNVNGITDVSVFEGSVEVRPPASQSTLLTEGEAVRAGREGKEVASIRYDASAFERAWPVALGVSKTAGSMRFVRPGPPWDLTEHRDDNYIVVFPETERMQLTEPLGVDSTQPGEILREQQTEGRALASDTTVRSYLLQFNPATRAAGHNKILTGQITFNHPIAGVIWNADRLAQTDAMFGAESSHYAFPGRGIEMPRKIKPPGKGRDRIVLSEDRSTLILKLRCGPHLDQIRVLVETD